MRVILLASTLLVSSGVAFAAPTQCTVPTEGGVTAAAVLPQLVDPRADQNPDASAPVSVLQITAEQISRVPALQRIASQGAELFELGTEHGLHGVFARRGSSFQVFYVTADGQAAVGGVMWSAAGQIPPCQ